jgi:hypothetical protein
MPEMTVSRLAGSELLLLLQKVQCSVDSQAVRRRVGGWCEVAAESFVKMAGSWMGAAGQRGTAIVEAVTRSRSVEVVTD